MFNLKKIINEFSKTKPTPSAKMIQHLNTLEKEYSREKVITLRGKVKKLKRLSKSFYKKM